MRDAVEHRDLTLENDRPRIDQRVSAKIPRFFFSGLGGARLSTLAGARDH